MLLCVVGVRAADVSNDRTAFIFPTNQTKEGSRIIQGWAGRFFFLDCLSLNIKPMCINNCGPGSSVGIGTELRAGRSGIESRWGRYFPPVQTGPMAHPASCKMGTGSFPGVKCRDHGRVELQIYPPSGPHRASNGITLPINILLFMAFSYHLTK